MSLWHRKFLIFWGELWAAEKLECVLARSDSRPTQKLFSIHFLYQLKSFGASLQNRYRSPPDLSRGEACWEDLYVLLGTVLARRVSVKANGVETPMNFLLPVTAGAGDTFQQRLLAVQTWVLAAEVSVRDEWAEPGCEWRITSSRREIFDWSVSSTQKAHKKAPEVTALLFHYSS